LVTTYLLPKPELVKDLRRKYTVAINGKPDYMTGYHISYILGAKITGDKCDLVTEHNIYCEFTPEEEKWVERFRLPYPRNIFWVAQQCVYVRTVDPETGGYYKREVEGYMYGEIALVLPYIKGKYAAIDIGWVLLDIIEDVETFPDYIDVIKDYPEDLGRTLGWVLDHIDSNEARRLALDWIGYFVSLWNKFLPYELPTSFRPKPEHIATIHLGKLAQYIDGGRVITMLKLSPDGKELLWKLGL